MLIRPIYQNQVKPNQETSSKEKSQVAGTLFEQLSKNKVDINTVKGNLNN
jgi:hypothetical protein